MKLDSKYFDKIRVKPQDDRRAQSKVATCDWPGCNRPGVHKAPRGREHEGEYYTFCVDHVRQYNKSYNYFSGMKDDEVAAFQSDARSGHRPTWKMGENASAKGKAKAHAEAKAKEEAARRKFDPLMGRVDPFGLFGEMGEDGEGRRRRPVRNAERKALSTLGLDETASAAEVKAKYKALVKKHHPDANGGSRDSEDRFREIVQAYDYLKSADFC